jgi:hypothetical protein
MPTSDRAISLIFAGLASIIILAIAYRYLIISATPAIAAATITASATVLVAVLGGLISKHLEQKREIDRELRERKERVYQDFMDYWFKAMTGARKEMSQKQKDQLTKEFRAESGKQLVFWSSPNVIKEYGDWVHWDDPEKQVDIFELEQLLFLMRKEFGFDDTGLAKGDLLRTFLKGVDSDPRVQDS